MRIRYLCVMILAFCSSAQGETMLVLGDSIAAGYGLPDVSKSWVSMLQRELKPYGWKVINAGVTGATTTDALARLSGLLNKHKPSITLIELGGNDGMQGTPIHRIRSNLGRIIAQVQGKGSEAVLIGITLPPNYGQRHIARFEKMYIELAAQHHLLFLSFAHTKVGTDPRYLQFDRIHPNERAQPLLFNLVLERLAHTLGIR